MCVTGYSKRTADVGETNAVKQLHDEFKTHLIIRSRHVRATSGSECMYKGCCYTLKHEFL